MWGENFDLSNPNGWLPAADASAAGITAIRFPMRLDTPLDLVAGYQARGIYLLGVLDKTAYENKVWIPELDAYQAGNEPDVTGKASWTMAPADFIALIQEIRGNHPHANLIAGGMASGSTAYWQQVMAAVAPLVNGFGIHFYGGTWTHVRTILRTFERYSEGLAKWVTEWDPASPSVAADIPAWHTMLHQEAQMAFHFCAYDSMVPPFGLYDVNGNQKPQYRAMAATR